MKIELVRESCENETKCKDMPYLHVANKGDYDKISLSNLLRNFEFFVLEEKDASLVS
jgi:hypothetical protein